MSIASAFVAARRAARALAAYPGQVPATMAEAYAVQDEAIALWGERPAGWKVGLVPPAHRAAMGVERLVGPIFAAGIAEATGGVMPMPVIAGGFGAVEAEFIVEVATDADPAKHSYTLEAAAALVGRIRVGVEPAGSPFAAINDHGPAVTASDFGNNTGLILGAALGDWRRDGPAMRIIASIDGVEAGRGGWESVPGTPLAAFAFALGLLAARGHRLCAGDLVTTGAVTGIHRVEPGHHARVSFEGLGEIELAIIAAAAA